VQEAGGAVPGPEEGGRKGREEVPRAFVVPVPVPGSWQGTLPFLSFGLSLSLSLTLFLSHSLSYQVSSSVPCAPPSLLLLPLSPPLPNPAAQPHPSCRYSRAPGAPWVHQRRLGQAPGKGGSSEDRTKSFRSCPSPFYAALRAGGARQGQGKGRGDVKPDGEWRAGSEQWGKDDVEVDGPMSVGGGGSFRTDSKVS